MAFDEAVLLDQDRFVSALLARPEFQKKMTGTELRYRLGAHLRGAGAEERRPGRVCWPRAIAWRFRCSWARRPMAAYSSIP